MAQVLKQGISFGLMVLLLFVIVPFSMAKEKEEKKEEKLTAQAALAKYKAQTAMSEKKFDEALAILDKYIATKPPMIPLPIYNLLGYIWLEKEDFEKAREYFKIMYEIKSDDPKILKNYAVLTIRAEQYGEAAVLYEKLYEIEETTEPGGSLYPAAQAYMLAEDYDNAKRVLKKLVVLPVKPDAKWYEMLIGICLQQEEDKEAERHIMDFLRINPVQAKYWKYLYQIRAKREEWQTATSDLEIAHRVETPEKQTDWKVLGDMYLRAVNAPLMGVRCYKEAYKDDSDEKGYLWVSRSYQAAYRYDDAIRALDEGIMKNPGSADLLFEKGRVLYEACRYKEAVEVLKECVKADPESGDAYFQMGLAAWTLMEWDTARTSFVQAKRLSERYSSNCSAIITLLDDLNKEKAELSAEKH